MNTTMPEDTRRYLAVFVIDLSLEFRALNNLLIDCEVDHGDDEKALIQYALRHVMRYWGMTFSKPQPTAVFISEKTLGRVHHYAEHALVHKLDTLRRVLEWAPRYHIDDLLIEEGVLYFCYERGEEHAGQ